MDPSTPSIDDRGIIVGREREQDQLRTFPADALTGHGQLVLISGEAGIGKTTLVRDLVHRADDLGALVLSGGCYLLVTTPLCGPSNEALRGCQSDCGQPPVSLWIAEPDDMNSADGQATILDDASRFFTRASDRQPLLIITAGSARASDQFSGHSLPLPRSHPCQAGIPRCGC